MPYASLVRRQPHADAGAVAASGLPERSLKRRFKAATGTTPINYVQNLRIEEAKRLLDTAGASFEDIAGEVGYDNPAFFRRVFRSRTGLTPGQYRGCFGLSPMLPPGCPHRSRLPP